MSKQSISDLFPGMIGQAGVKRKLAFYLSAYEATSILPHMFFVGGKGSGKTEFATCLARNLRTAALGGAPKPMLTINCSTIKNVRQFVEDIVLKYVQDQCITLFFDEAHELPDTVQTALLTVLNPNNKHMNTLRFEDYNLDFDFRKVSFVFATTDPQRVLGPLKDRCKQVHLEPYTYSDLAEIVIMNLEDGISVDSVTLKEISSTCRGNARNAVLMANDNINKYCGANNVNKFGMKDWNDIRQVLSIYPLGLENSEIQILIALEKGDQTLTGLSAITGLSRESISREYELYLSKKMLMQIDGKRKITKEGRAYLKQIRAEGMI